MSCILFDYSDWGIPESSNYFTDFRPSPSTTFLQFLFSQKPGFWPTHHNQRNRVFLRFYTVTNSCRKNPVSAYPPKGNQRLGTQSQAFYRLRREEFGRQFMFKTRSFMSLCFTLPSRGDRLWSRMISGQKPT